MLGQPNIYFFWFDAVIFSFVLTSVFESNGSVDLLDW